MQTRKAFIAAGLAATVLVGSHVAFAGEFERTITETVCKGQQKAVPAGHSLKFLVRQSQSSDPAIASLGFDQYHNTAYISGSSAGKAEVILTVAQTSNGGIIRDGVPLKKWLFNMTVRNCPLNVDAQIEQKPTLEKPDPGKVPVPLEPAYKDDLRSRIIK